MLATMSPSTDGRPRFLSGGHDGTVRMWTLTQDQGRNMLATSHYLSLSPHEAVGALAYQQHNDQVLVCYSRSISCAKLGAANKAKPTLLSAPPQQIHLRPDDPEIVILEVST